MKEYVLAMVACMWLADGVALLLAPRFLIDHLRPALTLNTVLWPWQLISLTAGIVLLLIGADLPYQPLWACVAAVMVLKGLALAWAPMGWREPALAWALSREDVDYRFWGLGLCMLAVLLFRALGWIGAETAG